MPPAAQNPAAIEGRGTLQSVPGHFPSLAAVFVSLPKPATEPNLLPGAGDRPHHLLRFSQAPAALGRSLV